MPDAPFHATQAGHRFYGHTMPELVRQLARLNENLERLAAALPTSPTTAAEPDPSELAAADDPPAVPGRHSH